MRWIIPILLLIALEIYAYQLIRTLSKGAPYKWIYIVLNALVFLNVFLQFFLHPDRTIVSFSRDLALTLFFAFFAVKVIFILFMVGEDVYRLVEGVMKSLSQKRTHDTPFLASRRKFISTIGISLAALPFGAILYGAWKGKYNYQVRSYELKFDDLPAEFDGYKITQLSDIHIGSFDNKEEVAYAINLTNQQQGDVILFTGDLVNNVTAELDGWEDILGSLTAPDGVYSVLGNHDYGDYYQWDTKEDKKANLEALFRIQKEMGWRLLLDENVAIQRADESLHLVGVQNWGGGRFPKYGDLTKASQGLSSTDFKVLLSHDPTHWDLQVKESDLNYQLTLSGHTHGMQFGIEIPGFVKLSPAWFVYKKWAGIYKEFGRFLNVNRGFGYLGYAGRAGIWPEITVITLKRSDL